MADKTEPKCPECGEHEFGFEIKLATGGPAYGGTEVAIVYCEKCGHIVGCTAITVNTYTYIQ